MFILSAMLNKFIHLVHYLISYITYYTFFIVFFSNCSSFFLLYFILNFKNDACVMIMMVILFLRHQRQK